MKRSAYIGTLVAGGAIALAILAAPRPGSPADAARPTDATRPTVEGDRSAPRGPNEADYHADYHVDYTSRDVRTPQPRSVEQQPDPRRDPRRFGRDARAIWTPYGWRR
jgi:hypothetical protein